jgi:dTMP kinase
VGQSRGLLITFEGGEGSGKSTQVRLLADWLEARGLSVVTARDPGSTRVGEAIREVVLDSASIPMSARTELLLYVAARAQLVEEVVLPALAQGKVVLLDRYEDSTYAYQGAARGIPEGVVQQVNEAGTGGLKPDLTVLIDIEAEEGIRRRREDSRGRPEDRLEGEGSRFHERVREAYRARAGREPVRFAVVDGRESPETIQAQVRQRVTALLALALSQGHP